MSPLIWTVVLLGVVTSVFTDLPLPLTVYSLSYLMALIHWFSVIPACFKILESRETWTSSLPCGFGIGTVFFPFRMKG